VKNPRRNVLLATVLLCLITGVLGCLEVYMGQLVWPEYWSFPNEETAFVSAAGRAGGPWMFQLVNIALLAATIGSSAGAQTGAVRLLYAMGRDRVLPPLFAHLDPVRRTPTYNALLTGAVALACALTLSYQTGVELLNFGAFIAFMGVNLAAAARCYLRAQSKGPKSVLLNLLPPLAGFAVCFGIWWSLRTPAKIAGGCWLLAGLAYCAWKTGLFRRPLPLTYRENEP
jgi:amino acid transporter